MIFEQSYTQSSFSECLYTNCKEISFSRFKILSMRKNFSRSNLKQLKNIGNAIEHYLNEIGIFTKAELMSVGPAEAFKQIQSLNRGKLINTSYYLYSLEGALLNLKWKDIPEKLKYHLKKQAGLAI